MIPYPKIKTLFERDTKTFKVVPGAYTLDVFRYLQDCAWYITEKIDGTNIRVYWDGETVRIYGRTEKSSIPTFLLDSLQFMFPPSRFKGRDPLCLYGEGYGNKIQTVGKDYLPDDTGFILFDVRVGDWWLQIDDVEGVAKSLGISHVPTLLRGDLKYAQSVVQDGFHSLLGDCKAEGVVLRPTQQLFTRHGERIIAKLKTKDFQ
jgi:ATP-dependent RNA circularization protein (DNA/RNA ligase family)